MKKGHGRWVLWIAVFGVIFLCSTHAGPLGPAASGGAGLHASAQVASGGEAIVLSGSGAGSNMLQFKAGGHLLGFQPKKVYFASLDHALSVEFLGTPGVMPKAAAEGRETGNKPKVPTLSKVVYEGLWEGISLTYEPREGGIVESTYQIGPGADVSKIRLRYNAAVEAQRDGSLNFKFERGYPTESPPMAWQEIGSRRVPVEVAFGVSGGEVGFSVGKYDPRYPLTIDPTYAWHTFYDTPTTSTYGDYSPGPLAVDSSGNVYVTGYSDATWNGPAGQDPLHAYSGGDDIFVPKLSQVTNESSIPLVKINDHLYQTENCLFLIDTDQRINWPDYFSLFYDNLDYYLSELKAHYSDDFFTVTIIANNLTPLWSPRYNANRYKAEGIGFTGDTGVPDICRYNEPDVTSFDLGLLGVFDHEIGHAWGVAIEPMTQGGTTCSNFHWPSNSTAWGQMNLVYSEDNFITVKRIIGNEASGFNWVSVDNFDRNRVQTFWGQDLYLMGLHPTFPSLYVLNDPVYNPDYTMSYSSVTKYDHQTVVSANGPRIPDYRSSEKRFRIAFIYVARDLDEVNSAYQGMEGAIRQFCYSEQIDMGQLHYTTPFLVETNFRASVDCRLADLDGNTAPQLSIGSSYISSSTGVATIPFTAQDPDGPSPAVSCVPSSANCSIVDNNVVVQGLPNGAHFFTIKAEDAGQKKVFAHFVVDVTKPEQETISAPEVPYGPWICLLGDTYSYSTVGSISDLGHGVEYRFDWGDGTYSDWASSQNVSKTWNASGTHLVRAQARCATDLVESDFSIGLVVYVPEKSYPYGTFSNVTDTCIRASVDFVNPEGTQYYFENTVAHTNSGWTTNMYWDSCGLTCGTTYTFWLKINNTDGTKSEWYFVGDQSTTPCETVTVPSLTGPTSGVTGVPYSYSAGGASSSLGHPVEYQFDWKGDGSDLSPWGASTQSKTWTATGTYSVKARARCAQDTSIVSSWSEALLVVISTSLPGDCNGDGQTTIDEVQRSINQFLGIAQVQPCCDLNGDGQVTIDEVQKVINAFLGI
jgi:hypothetical protein